VETFFPAFLALWLGGPPVLVGLWFLDRWRAKRRNGRGECALCSVPWASVPVNEPHLIQGRLVCRACAIRAKRRIAWQFSILGVSAALGTAIAIRGADPLVLVALPGLALIGGSFAALRLMKLANRHAQSRIAAGKLPLP
jgi:hypothetical protein